MKKYSNIIIKSIFVFSIFVFWKCQDEDSFLDKKVGATLNEEIVFADSTYTMDYLSALYQGLYFWYNTGTPNAKNGPWNEITDEADTRWPGGHNFPNQIFDGTFGDPFYKKMQDMWTHFYTRIRQCNIYLKEVNEDSPLSEALKKRTKAEIRFLRAYHYYLLIEGWGGVPIVGDNIFSLSAPNDFARNTWAECVDYIVSELDAAVQQLPVSYSGIDYGRITQGSCLALKSRVLLFAASPLYNGGSPAQDATLKELTAYPSYNETRWQKAYQAAQDLVNLNAYQLETDNETRPGNGFYSLFLKRVSNEIILARMQGPNKDIEKNQLPKSRGGSFRRYPTQDLVDAFPMNNGLSISDPNSGYDPENPYENRDPRFYYTIIYNGAPFFNKGSNTMEPIWTYVGAKQDGFRPITSNSGTWTGYYARKMMDELVAANGSATSDRSHPVVFRYAEILLNLAEAANEIGNTSLAMDQLIKIRERAGLEPGANGRYGLPGNPSKDEARELIRNERFVELAFEMHRFWDLKRWKATWLDGQYRHGMKITKSGNNFSYERIETRPLYYKDNIFYFPIPRDEVFISPNLIQNPGW